MGSGRAGSAGNGPAGSGPEGGRDRQRSPASDDGLPDDRLPDDRLPVASGRELLDWYRRDARDLPWRRTDDPYAILVSELMLQQTRVETVLGRYESFLRRFPDFETLAEADEEEVLAEWSGLGYYRRARSLHTCARRIVDEHGGELPREPERLRELPGIGPYTAAAVTSIAFGRPALAVDGNVGRVLCRLAGLREDPRRAAARRLLETLAEPWLEALPPGDVNQALMELGARLCLPRSPRCLLCPVADACVARRQGVQEEIPPSRRSRNVEVEEVAAVLERDGRYVLVRGQRPGVLADMWEFPTLDSRLAGDVTPEDANAENDSRRAQVLHYLDAIGVESDDVAELSALGEIRHGITHRRIRCHVYAGRYDGPYRIEEAPAQRPEATWATPADALRLPLAASARKTIDQHLDWPEPSDEATDRK